MVTESINVLDHNDRHFNYAYRDNCVFYARWLTSGKLVTGLISLEDKKRHINCHKPRKGSVAVLDINGSVGHVAYVYDVDDSGKDVSITLLEANYPANVERKRKIKGHKVNIRALEQHAKIIGYIKA